MILATLRTPLPSISGKEPPPGHIVIFVLLPDPKLQMVPSDEQEFPMLLWVVAPDAESPHSDSPLKSSLMFLKGSFPPMSGFASSYGPFNPSSKKAQDVDDDNSPMYQPSVHASSTGRRGARAVSPPSRSLAKFTDFTVSRSVSAAHGTSSGSGRKLLSASLPAEYVYLADLMQAKCEASILFIFRGVKIHKYWTNYPKSLSLIVAVPEAQFADEFKSQFGADALTLFLQDITTLPFHFPLVPAGKLTDDFPADHVPVKLRLSETMLDKFKERGSDVNMPSYKKDAIWDLYVVVNVYHATADIPVPGFTFRLQRAEERSPR